MRALVSKTAPYFKGKVYSGAKKTFEDVNLTQFKGKYLLLSFYPLDFTFVCPTEILEINKLKPEFEKRNCNVLMCSTDSHFSHKAWVETPKEKGGFGNELQIDLLSDFTKEISSDYGVLLEESGVALRGSFLIDPDQVLRHSTINDLPVGRNMDEYLRLIDAFDFVAKHGEVCPAKWKKPGDPTMKGSHEAKETQEYWKKHFSK